MNRLTTSQGTFELARFPEHPSDPFRAWDAADEYLLRQLTDPETGPVDLTGAVAVVGDRWGALATALAAHRPFQISDSYLARRATQANLDRNGLDPAAVTLLSSRDTPPDRIDVLLVRVPKSLAFLEDQLHRIAPALHAGTVVIGTGMVKEIHTSTLKLFERIVGPTRTSLAVRKARLIFSTPDPELTRTPSPWPYRYELPGDVGPVAGRTAVNHAGIFCAERLDVGTRFFLKHLPTRGGSVEVADLGCGNGVLGLSAALANPDAHVTFVDESYGAVASAEETFRLGAPEGAKADFLVGDGLTDLTPGSLDLVLNNPPFHSHMATTDATARTMFVSARTALRQGGELWVVGNRHLSYHTHLRRIFGNCTTVAGDPKFVVLRAVKR
ncbi:methyltransferase [Streptomyces sp. ISL-111]|uniref:methyltransferase n=1 Tax=unclassified Streptomyces TaxID=2593676 RepID=UPI001BE4EAFF|nr:MULTISPECIES: methyltransferase [unclassified Streptomyces]MBT2375991.1 methyltransferase [Streptomyces sp. ISL-111]MBT2428119.1 methyltransferase [Streptomyces sp. ISL-112]MBT2463086.1 methyltransferase [Streptomyces sp. ISL-63]